MLALTMVTGFSGLVYEVAWERYLGTLLGSQSEATAAVLGLYLGGLSLGYAVFGRAARRVAARSDRASVRSRLVRLYGGVEIGIGVFALLFPWSFAGVRALSLWLPGADGIASFAIDVLLCAVLVLPPTVLMGGTIPLLTQALPVAPERATRLHALVYGSNTLGATVGAIAAAFFLIPGLGLAGAAIGMGCVNLAAGLAFLLLARRFGDAATETASEVIERTRAPASSLAIALLIGFAMMTVQATVIRVGGLSLGASPFTFAIVVAVFVLGIGAGSLVVGALRTIPRGALTTSLGLLGLWLIALYLLLEAAPYGAHLLRTLFRDNAAAFGLFQTLAGLAALGFVGPAALLSGATLPLLFDCLRGRYGDLGQAAGSLYSWNTIGSLAGALLGGYALLFWLDLHHVFLIAIVAAFLAAGLSASFEALNRRRLHAAIAAAVASIAVLALPAWRPEAMASGMFRVRGPTPESYQGMEAMIRGMAPEALLFHDDDPIATVTVPEKRVGDERTLSLVTNGKSDGNTLDDYATMSLAALIPAVLVEPLQNAFVIGLGTGITAGELASLDGMERVVVAEISPAVVEAAALFDFASLGASRHPRIDIQRRDAYRALSRSPERFDVIISEPSNPWTAGVEMLFAQEFYQSARSRLSDHGLFVQWIHEYESNDETLALVLRTFDSVFPRSTIWYGNGPDLILVGFADAAPVPDFLSVARRARRPDVMAGLRRAGIESLPELFAHELLPFGVLAALPKSGPLHTLYHPRLNDVSARAFFAGGGARLPFSGSREPARIGAARSLFAQFVSRRTTTRDGLENREWRAFADELCRHRTRECVTALARWSVAYPGSRGIQRIVQRRRRDRMGGPFPADAIPALARLFDGGTPPPASTSPDQLRRATELFSDFYFHAVPFDRASLRALRGACEPDRPGACEEVWQQSARRIGP